jgi:NADH dehydrogenase
LIHGNAAQWRDVTGFKEILERRAAMMLVLGGTGLLGGHVLKRLRDERYPVRLLTRGSRDWQDAFVHDVRSKGAEFVVADAVDRAALLKAAEGCTAIINLVGNMPPKPLVDLHALHVTVAQNVLAVAREKGIQRIVQVSCLGAAANGPGNYLRTRFEGDEEIINSELYWTLIRASYIFGDHFPFLKALMPLVKFRLFMPIIGSGQNELQPVHVDDVAACIVKSIYDRETVGKTFELAGSHTYSYQELMQKTRKALKLGGQSMNIPSQSAERTAEALSKFIPKSAINVEILQLLQANSVTQNNALESYFKRDPIDLDTYFEKVVASL